jgi:hypothetical protein
MQVDLIKALKSAFEVTRNLLKKDGLTQPQEYNLQMALSLILISRSVFDYVTDRKELEVLKNWPTNCPDIRKYYLARKPDGKHYLYTSYIDLPYDTGVYISADEKEFLINLPEKIIDSYWNNILNKFGFNSDQGNNIQMTVFNGQC